MSNIAFPQNIPQISKNESKLQSEVDKLKNEISTLKISKQTKNKKNKK